MAGTKKSPFIYTDRGVGIDARLGPKIEMSVEEAQAAALSDLADQSRYIAENLGAIAEAVDRLASAIHNRDTTGASMEYAGTQIRDGLDSVAASLGAIAKRGGS